jgi:ribosomal-protein-alanine N-acetyltransferase
MSVLSTPRLALRHWVASDLAPFAELNADPAAMAFMPRPLTALESDEFAARAQAGIEAHGWGLWAVQLRAGGQFLGCVGLSVPTFAAHFTPCVEAMWRLLPRYWGQGYATEAARAVCRFGFESLLLEELLAFTVPGNTRSRAVMERLGMAHEARDDFDHPRLPAGDRLCRHVLYRLSRAAWSSQSGTSAAHPLARES